MVEGAILHLCSQVSRRRSVHTMQGNGAVTREVRRPERQDQRDRGRRLSLVHWARPRRYPLPRVHSAAGLNLLRGVSLLELYSFSFVTADTPMALVPTRCSGGALSSSKSHRDGRGLELHCCPMRSPLTTGTVGSRHVAPSGAEDFNFLIL